MPTVFKTFNIMENGPVLPEQVQKFKPVQIPRMGTGHIKNISDRKL